MANINEVVCNLWKQYRGDCKMKKKTIVWIIVVVVIIALGIMVVKRAKKRDAESPVAKTYSMVVSTIKPELKEVTLTLPYLALVQNDDDVILSSKISARIESIKPVEQVFREVRSLLGSIIPVSKAAYKVSRLKLQPPI